MPFKLKLKRSRQYNVTSKSLFVISVEHLLDTSTNVDCTLSSESTGQECLDNVCQRLSINQPEFFGLRYVVKGNETENRWIDLERPLSRQLDKHAAYPRLFLRVMYYVVSGVQLITDEVTRYYYFLQIKSDVVEGRINCDPQQAVILAIYARQAEYDIHQKDKHTIDYLKTMLPFPKRLIEAGLSEKLTEEVLQQNAELNNLTQAAAEELYILTCQQLEGYGQEKFTAKNDSSQEVILGITVSGISVFSNDYIKIYYWRDISNVVNLKRTFNIECTAPENSVGFTLHDADSGRYFWKLCVLQHTFYTKYERNMSQNSQMNLNLFSNIPEDLNDSRDNLLIDQTNWRASDQQLTTTATSSSSATTNNWQSTEIPILSNLPSATSQQTIDSNWTTSMDYSNRNSNWGLALAGSNASLNNRAQSSSCLDLSNNNNNSNNNNGSSGNNQDRERLKSLLPTYRPAPDYETAVQQKYRPSSSDLRLNTSVIQVPSGIISDPHINAHYSGSQPDVHRAALTDAIFGAQLQQHYPDVTQTTNPIYSQQLIDPNLYGMDNMTQRFRMMRLNKPPPPYPANRLSSTSTPDLALASHRALMGYRGAYVSGSSPDLVSSRTFLNPHGAYLNPQTPNSAYYPTAGGTIRLRHSQSYLPHGTYENLNYIDAPKPMIPPPIQKVYDGKNVIYCLSRDVEQLLIQDQQQQQQQQQQNNGHVQKLINNSTQHINGSIEPIYENVPLPWQNENNSSEMRDRTSSVQSAPGVIRQHIEIGKPIQPILTEEQINILDSHQNDHHHHHHHHHHHPPPPPPPHLQHHQHQHQHQHLTHESLTINNVPESLQQHRPVTKTSSNPITATNHFTSSSSSTELENNSFLSSAKNDIVISLNQNNNLSMTNDSMTAPITTTTASLQAETQSSLLNRSHSANLLDSSQSSNFTMTTNDSGISSGVKEKRKRRWGILSRGKNSLSDKQKSATLGREKEKHKNSWSKEEEDNIKHRWSTGLPRLQPLPANISKEKLCQLLEAKLNDTQLFMEFERIPKRKDNAKYECALLDENKVKNLDPNFLPHDDNRVRLVPTMNNRTGYVNASHITATVGSKQRFYIVAQSPFDKTTANIFWQCVWEADVYLLVQLSEEIMYVPTNSEKCLEFGQYQVWREFSQETDRCVTSKLRIYHIQSRRFRSVWHISYSDWNEQNCPKAVAHYLDFLEELNSVRLASINEIPPGHNTNPPVLIHCSEGGGRAGVTLAADLLLFTLDHNQDLDIPRVVGQLRHQRDNIIPSLAQYKFIYALLIHYLKQTRLI